MINRPADYAVTLTKGVSTLDAIRRCLSLMTLALFLIVTIAGGNAYAAPGHSTLDGVSIDPTFNAQLTTGTYNEKEVSVIVPLANGKTLVAGRFNSYNRTPTNRLVRLNADGSLDQTFKADSIKQVSQSGLNSSGISAVAVLKNGEILVGGSFFVNDNNIPRILARLKADGSLDEGFDFGCDNCYFGAIGSVTVRADQTIILTGYIPYLESDGSRSVVIINYDGSVNTSFEPTESNVSGSLKVQADKYLIFGVSGRPVTPQRLRRFNFDGTIDNGFAPRTFPEIQDITVLPDNKIILQTNTQLRRLNEDGTDDNTFQVVSRPNISRVFAAPDNKILVAHQPSGNQYGESVIERFTGDGSLDPSFNRYTFSTGIAGFGIQPDGKILLGEARGFGGSSNTSFKRLNADGTEDLQFNPNGVAFQNTSPGRVEAVAVQADNKIVIGGNFDFVENTNRYRVARVSESGAVDESFAVSRLQAGNTFQIINQIHSITVQPDNKIVMTGSFSYLVNGTAYDNLVRLNPSGAIDPTFLPGVSIDNNSLSYGRAEAVVGANGKVLVGTSRLLKSTSLSVPLLLNQDGARATEFDSQFKSGLSLRMLDLVVQPDGKILIGGSYTNSADRPFSFIARLNPNGSLDTSFQAGESAGRTVVDLAVQPDGKILLVANSGFQPSNDGILYRLNADGSVDASFAPVSARGGINKVLPLPNGKIIVGGRFDQINGRARKNLAIVNSDGKLDTTVINANQEVLSLALDNQQRVLIGGAFTSINTGNSGMERTYLARLIGGAKQSTPGAAHDFDGDGKSDISVFRPTSGMWYLLNSTTGFAATQWGNSSDRLAPADYDGDGKTDVAVYRPADNTWYILKSREGFATVRFGIEEDIPVPADYDGDGRADIAVYRPSNGTWYRLNSGSGNSFTATRFGIQTDVPTIGDYDGDGKSDLAVWRASNGTWYVQQSTKGFTAVQFGVAEDKPAAGDYDGDGKTDFAVFRPSSGVWFVLGSTTGFSAVQFGNSQDTATPGDYDGDGKSDFAVFRAATKTWYILNSKTGFTALEFGVTTDKAVPAGVNR